MDLSKKKKKQPPAYISYALASQTKSRDERTNTTVPTEDMVEDMRRWDVLNQK